MDQQNIFVPPGGTIGILGGGQLGRMIAAAALRMGYHVAVLAPENHPPAGALAGKLFTSPYADKKTLQQFAKCCDVVTLEFENIPSDVLHYLSERVPVRPGAKILQVTQDRVAEKSFFDAHKIPTARWQPISDTAALSAVRHAYPAAVLKYARDGYDGKGQWMLTPETPLPKFSVSAILEEKIRFAKEISVLIARGQDGRIVHFPPVHNVHQSHILRETFAPAAIDAAIARRAVEIARRIIETLEMVGLLAVEMFLTEEGTLLVNELAPRPHNSGHWSLDGANICQFELLIRAVCGLPLVMPRLLCPIHMVNLLGEDIHQWQDYLFDDTARFYHYGKAEIFEGRKMGHVNFRRPSK